MFQVYILKSSSSGKYYIGQTDNLEDRVRRHNTGQCQFTKDKGPWELVYQKKFNSRSEALKEEIRIKQKKSRKYIEWLIQSESV